MANPLDFTGKVVLVTGKQVGKFQSETGRSAGDEGSLMGCHGAIILN